MTTTTKMTDEPFFTIMLPAKGRPGFVRDALSSILWQTFKNFEVLVSNNGANAAVREAINDLLRDSRVRYIEQPSVLPMPTHWEQVSRLARGRYFTVLTDRSVLKQGALDTIARIHRESGVGADVLAWPWDLYYDHIAYLLRYPSDDPCQVALNSDDFILSSLKISSSYPYALPRALNASVARSLLNDLRAHSGSAFLPLNPDFSFAYSCLMLRPEFVYLNRSLMISQGFLVSTGGQAMKGSAGVYLKSLGLEKVFEYAPIKASLVQNTIFEDFFRAAHRHGRIGLIHQMNRCDYFLRCFAEIDEKYVARIVSPADINELQRSVEDALEREDISIRTAVRRTREAPVSFGLHTRRMAKHLLGERANLFQPLLLRVRGAVKYKSALHAAGFRS